MPTVRGYPQVIEEGFERAQRREEAKTERDQRSQRGDQNRARGAAREARAELLAETGSFCHRRPSAPLIAQLAAVANRSAALAACLGAAVILSAPALADGLVLKSAAAGYARGDVIKDGAAIKLTPGEIIVVLDRSGATRTFSEPGVYSAEQAAAKGPSPQRISAVRAAVFAERRSAIGGTRANEFEICLGLAKTRPDITASECRSVFPHDIPAPKLGVRLASGNAVVGIGAPLHLDLSISFDAAVACTVAGVNDPDLAYPLSLAGDGAWLEARNAGDGIGAEGAANVKAPAARGDYRIVCRAFELDGWRSVREAAPMASVDETLTLAKAYGGMRSAPYAESSIALSVRP